MTSLNDQQLVAHADRVAGKVVLITGAASGIGKETALLFATHGAKLVLGDIDGLGAQRVANEINNMKGEAIARPCDVTKWDDQVVLFEAALSEFGTIDIVVPNAGITEQGGMFDLMFKDGKPQPPNMKTIDVNVTSVIYTTHLALHYLRNSDARRDGTTIKAIVLVGSVASWCGVAAAPLYSTSKHAILGLLRGIAPYCTASGIRVGCVHPWFADTQILDRAARSILVGLPLTPVSRIAATILCVAADPDPETSEKPWLLLDDGDVLRMNDAVISEGAYRILDARMRTTVAAMSGLQYYGRIMRDLGKIFNPMLNVVLLILVGLFLWRNA